MENKNFGELLRANLREILHDKKLTMTQAEKIIGRPRALRNFLNGTQATPSVGSLFLFSKALDVPMHRIFGESIEDVSLSGKTINLLLKILGQLRNNEDFLKKQHSLSKIAKMVLALQKMTEATQADEVDLAFLEEFLLKL